MIHKQELSPSLWLIFVSDLDQFLIQNHKLLTTGQHLQLLLFLITGFCLWARFFGIDIIQLFSVRSDFVTREQLPISGDILVVKLGVGGKEDGGTTGILWVEVKDADKHSTVHRTAPYS